MELSIKMNGTCSDFTETVSVDETESDIWKEIGKRLLKAEVPSEIIASCSLGSASLNIRQRGTFVKDGITYPSMYVTVSYNNINVPADTYSEAYLTCVNPECNNYKFYHLRPTGSVINATYGRIGSQRGEAFGVKDLSQPYESYLYWVRYYEKISKGYMDQTEIYLSPKKVRKSAKKIEVEPTDEAKPKVNQLSAALYSQLKGYARHVVKQNLRNYENITAKQISKGKYFLRQMGQRVTVKGFNSQLKNLISISPRNTRDVSALFAKSVNDFAAIVQREENLLLAMEAMVQGEKTPEYTVPEECFEAHGIKVLPATEKQKTDIMSRLSANLQGKVKNIYRVINPKQQERFDNYLKTENIKKVKMFWHGSRNENWLSIILNGLQLNPNAKITGKMFGQGIYFAPSSEKSWGYVSYYGSRWANGRQNTGFMGLYATAYGTPLDVTGPASYNQNILRQRNKNCVHAHKGTYLYNDEIVFYHEDAILLNFLVEFN